MKRFEIITTPHSQPQDLRLICNASQTSAVYKPTTAARI